MINQPVLYPVAERESFRTAIASGSFGNTRTQNLAPVTKNLSNKMPFPVPFNLSSISQRDE
jgi:hypothetical protein